MHQAFHERLFYINKNYFTSKNFIKNASGKTNCFSPASNLTRKYFFALSIQTIAPLPNFLCVTVTPICTFASISSSAFSAASLSSSCFCAAVLSVTVAAISSSTVFPDFSERYFSGIKISSKSVIVACCLLYNASYSSRRSIPKICRRANRSR